MSNVQGWSCLFEFSSLKYFRMTIYESDAANKNAVIEAFKVFGFVPKPGYHFHHPTPFGSIARYRCDAGDRWNRRIDNFDLTTHDITCQTDGSWTENWPTCADITQCPDPTSLAYPEEIETTWEAGESLDYLTKIAWKCKDRRFLIQRIGDETTRGETIENECLWYSNYSFPPSDLECILTYCDQVVIPLDDS